MSAAKIKCVCTHEFQDKEHGSQTRVATVSMKGTGNANTKIVRCTVCSREQTVSVSQVKGK